MKQIKSRTRILAWALTILMVLTIMPATAVASSTYSGDGYSFDADTGELTVSTSGGTTNWHSNESFGVTDVKAVQIASGVTTIRTSAFSYCTALQTVTFASPNTLKTIGDYAFEGCANLTVIEIPASVTTIGLHAFSDCTALETVTFADDSKLTTIDDGAFWDCTSLRDITLPASITSIDGSAFVGCTSLSGLTISDGNTSFVIEGNILYKKDKSVLIMYYLADTESSFEIPNTVTEIGNYAFSGCTNLKTVTFSNESKLTTIAEGAFQMCTSLEEIQIPDSVDTIESEAFWGCTDLQTVTFTEGSKLTVLDWWVFRDCSSLSHIAIPASVETIRQHAFKGCTALQTVDFAEGSKLTTIEWEAFRDCSSLADIRIPASVTKIGSAAFDGCTSLAAATFAEGSKLTSIGAAVFAGCTKLSGITIPATVETIGQYAFSSCSALKTVTFASGSTLAAIDASAFFQCTGLTSITIPASVETISDGAFSWCTALELVTFEAGSRLETIGEDAFLKCTSLTGITIPASVETIGKYAFYDCTGLATVDFASGINLKSIEQSVFQNCSSLTGIDIPASVESIKGNAFYGCSSLANIDIPASVTDITASAFIGCATSGSLTVHGDNLNFSAENNVLYDKNKTALLSYHLADTGAPFEIPGTVTEISNYAFEFCINLKDINIPTTVAKFGEYAFRNCAELTYLEIPASITDIGDYAFGGCTDLRLKFLGSTAPTTLAPSFAGVWGNSIKQVLYPAAWSSADVARLREELGTTFLGSVTPYGGSSSRPPTPTTEIQTDGGTVTASVTVQPTSAAGGLELTLPAGPVGQAIDQALAQAGESGNRVEVDIHAAGGRNAEGLQATLPTSVLDKAVGKGIDSLNIITDGISLSFDYETLETLSGRSGGEDVTIALSKTPHEELPDEQRRSVSDDSLIFTVNTTTPSGRIDGAGVSIGVSVPYTLRDGQSPDSIVVCYVDNAGNITKVPTFYDAETGMLTFVIPHLSVYAVFDTWVADAINKVFADVSASDWFYGDVKYVYTNKLFMGTSEIAFSPNQGMTRGMFATVLYRLAGEPAYSEVSAFKDIPENEYYAIPVAWAAAQNLVKGYSDERFGPNDPVAREQMALILMNYALSTGLDVSDAADLSAFIDAESVSDWAERAVSWANAAGLLNGSGGKLMPAGNATRAEVAAVLHRFALGSTR
jgi:hypothetical protein